MKLVLKKRIAAQPLPVKKTTAPAYVPHVQLDPGKEPEICTRCKHLYTRPCHGGNEKCGNLVFLKEQIAASQA